MEIPNFFIVEILENYTDFENDMRYEKGINIMVREDLEIDYYEVLNTTDKIPKSITRKMF